MWKLKIAEGNDPYLFSTNNFIGRQTWEFDPDAGTFEERQQVENARQYFLNRQKAGFQASSDLLMRMQLIKENGIDIRSVPPVRLTEREEVNHEAVTIAVKKAVLLHRAIQAKDGHWPAEHAGPLFFTPPLIIVLYISGAINTHLTKEHKKEMKRFIYNHQEDLFNPHSTIQDLLWDGLHHFSEPLFKYFPFTKLRERALKRAIELIRYSAEESRYITMACVEKSLQMMVWWAENPSGDEFKHHLARVPDYLWLAEDGMKMQTFGSQLWDCTLATQAILATNMVEQYGDSLKKANFYIKESQVKNNPNGDFKKMFRQLGKGSWTFTDQDHGLPVSDCTAEALKCLLLLSQMPEEISGEKVSKERLYDAVNFLLFVQSPTSGGFAIWERPVPQPYLEKLNPSELFADIVVEKEHLENTASIIQALLAFKTLHPGYKEEEIEISVAKAVCFLEERQRPDGSWYGYWGICFLYAACFVLGGLVAAGKTYNNSEAVRKGVNFVLSTQNEEGGWGESYKSCTTQVFTPLDGNRTNLVQTSWAMLGLMSAGQAERDPTPLHKAAKLLVNGQMDNGDFPQREFTGASLRHCMLHYAQYRNIFPMWALAEYRNRLWTKR